MEQSTKVNIESIYDLLIEKERENEMLKNELKNIKDFLEDYDLQNKDALQACLLKCPDDDNFLSLLMGKSELLFKIKTYINELEIETQKKEKIQEENKKYREKEEAIERS